MAGTRELRQRIDSVNKTKKITQAMKMVSAAKFKRANRRITQSRLFSQSLNAMVQRLVNGMAPEDLPQNFQANNSGTICVISIAGDRGLCGGFNSNVLKHTEMVLKNSTATTELVAIGNRASQFFKRRNWTLTQTFQNYSEQLSYTYANEVIQPILKRFLEGEIGKIVLIYTHYKGGATTFVVDEVLLPLDVTSLGNTETTTDEMAHDWFFEPNKSQVLHEFLTQSIVYRFYRALMESTTAEELARMTAMESATDNCDQMAQDLTLLYNRTRQATITKELSEIVSGAEALMN